ncbi:MAG TPA: MBL fold metallo-hydrolase [Tepidisphaeraceae bacterium]|nr:MBL fold metallo-hydrolase [Tepidisphaeraceae bacterium]
MKIISNTGGVFATCSYLVADEIAKQAVIFDAPNDTVAPLLDEAQRNGWDVIGLWLTHGHIDHIADHAVVTSRFPNAKVLIHPLDERKLQTPQSIYPLPFETPGRSADAHLSDGQQLRIGSIAVNVMHAPGHSPGHVVFHLPDEQVLIGGDVILMGAVGRTDFPDCSFDALCASIRRIMQLPGETHLLPGHGHPSTLDHEMQTNECVQQAVAGNNGRTP